MDYTLTPEDVARRLGVGRAFVYALIRDKELPAIRLSRKAYRISEEDLSEYLAERMTR